MNTLSTKQSSKLKLVAAVISLSMLGIASTGANAVMSDSMQKSANEMQTMDMTSSNHRNPSQMDMKGHMQGNMQGNMSSPMKMEDMNMMDSNQPSTMNMMSINVSHVGKHSMNKEDMNKKPMNKMCDMRSMPKPMMHEENCMQDMLMPIDMKMDMDTKMTQPTMKSHRHGKKDNRM